MPVTMEVREEGYVAYYVVADPWSVNDLMRWYPEDIAFRDSVHHKVHTFMDFSAVRQVPSNVLAVKRGAPAFVHPNSGQLIMVGTTSFVRVMAETIFKLVHYERAKFFDTEDPAWIYTRELISQEIAKVGSAATDLKRSA